MKQDKGTDLYPPVLPSWGSMLPLSPPSDYGNIRFDPDRELSARTVVENTPLDELALAALNRTFKRRLRTFPRG